MWQIKNGHTNVDTSLIDRWGISHLSLHLSWPVTALTNRIHQKCCMPVLCLALKKTGSFSLVLLEQQENMGKRFVNAEPACCVARKSKLATLRGYMGEGERREKCRETERDGARQREANRCNRIFKPF